MNKDIQSRRAFSESAYYEAYKAIRNKIRKYNPDALIDECFTYLHAPALNQLEYIQRQPWLVLLLIKWVLLDDQAMNPGRPAPNRQQILGLLNQIFDLAGSVRLPTEFEDISLFLRAMAYQQFLYQRRASPIVLGRQLLYFVDISDEHYISTTFEELTGIKLHPFLMLSQALISAFLDSPPRHRINASWFSTLGPSLAKDAEVFLSLFTATRQEMRDSLRGLDASIRLSKAQPRSSSEFFEQSPFLQRPLMRRHKTYECVDVHLLDACVGRFIYSRLREHDKGTFMGHFGPLFEAYVRKAIVHMGIPFYKEKELAKQIPTKNKPSLIDFVVRDSNTRIFIDAKAVEMHYRGKVTHSMAELTKNLETSLLKAIKQAHSTRIVLAELGLDTKASGHIEDWLLVVTESELYVSNGVVLASAVGQNTLDELMPSDSEFPNIPLDRMYFLTIQEFERLSAAINSKQCGFAQALSRARHADADPMTRRMVFDQHLDDMGIRKIAPDYVIAETTKALKLLAEAVRQEARQ